MYVIEFVCWELENIFKFFVIWLWVLRDVILIGGSFLCVNGNFVFIDVKIFKEDVELEIVEVLVDFL